MAKIKGIRVISFDADGTLWDFEKVMRHSLTKVYSELVKAKPSVTKELTIDKMIAIRDQVAQDPKNKNKKLEEIRLEAFRSTLKAINYENEDFARFLNQIYLKHRFEEIELYPDVISTLDLIQKKYVIGLLSNGNSYPKKCGLDNRFSFVVLAQDYGIKKPDPRLFEVALKEAKCSKDEFLHVGDSIESDIVGAQRVGVKSVFLNRTNQDSSKFSIDFEISSLLELPELLD
ncbi:MAG: HAD-IA family hydrolase [Candidatus Heimdallarchaeota archaeon]|nr:HAD-IA family hydrolase [Candidatus Heimdallarchaeota archaeon]